MAVLIVGLTGGIGSGKSTVATLFQQQGIDAVDADIVAREVVAAGSPCLIAIAEHFGADILTDSGELDRAALRQRIFSDPDEKCWLEQLLHPAIRERLLQQLALCRSPYALLIAPLLLENGLQRFTNRVLVVDIPETLQQTRTLQRDKVSEQQVAAIMAAQFSRQQRLNQADDVIDNSGDTTQLLPQVKQLHQQYLALAATLAAS